jgi:hypothetical protein
MIALSPRNFVHRGSISACGFMIPCEAMGTGEARKRVFELWQPGVQVKRVDGFDLLLVTFPEPVRVIAEQALGEPLVRHDRLLVALPLDPGELGILNAAGDSLVFANAGRIQVVSLKSLPDADMSRWIDMESVALAEVKSLGVPPAAPVFVAHEFNSRDMPGIPPASSELQKLLAELRREPRSTGSVKQRLWGKFHLGSLRKALDRLFQYLRNLPLSLKAGVRAKTQTPGRRAAQPARRSNPIALWFRRYLIQLSNITRFSQLLGMRHGRYLARLMAMMQSGDLDQGLRHAIPLSDAAVLGERRMGWFSTPRPRTDLSIDPFRARGQGPAWVLPGQIFQYLRNLYRQAFQRLEVQGRIEEAAFVLTELLASHAEAVSFLEKHGRLHLAAEIAEAKKLSPALAVRLWWLAKERKRAITLAIRTGEFERAIQHLSGSHPHEADVLRLVWAERLAASGKYIAAVNAVWRLPNKRHRALPWLDQAIELGGTAGGVALAWKAARFPESFPQVLPRVEGLLADQNGETARARNAFTDSLRHEVKNPESQTLARLAIRSLVRDVQQGLAAVHPEDLRHLLDYTEDASLRADVPRLEALQCDPKDLPQAQAIEIAAGDVGRRSITDLALLPDGKMLLALGEAGLLFLSRDGRPIAESNQPAHQLVISDDGSRAIGIAHRGSVSRLVLVNLVARTAAYWCDTTITAHTRDFDGSAWFVADGADVFLIDTLARGFEALWRIPDFGNVRVLKRNRKKQILYVLSDNREQLTLWTFQQPAWVLRVKSEYTMEPGQGVPVAPDAKPWPILGRAAAALSDQGDVFEQLSLGLPESKIFQSMIFQVKGQAGSAGRVTVGSSLTPGRLRYADSREGWIAIPVWQENGIDVFRLDISSGLGPLVARLQGATQIAVRFSDQALLCADDRGRVLGLDTVSGRVVRDLRI